MVRLQHDTITFASLRLHMYLLVLVLGRKKKPQSPHVEKMKCQKEYYNNAAIKMLLIYGREIKSFQTPCPVLLVASQTSRYRSNGGVWQRQTEELQATVG